MIRDMKKPIFTARDVEEATGGVIDAKTCHNWTARRQWITPQGPNPRGKARRYSLMHVIEAAFRAELVALGLSHELARQAAASAFKAGISEEVHARLNTLGEMRTDKVQQAGGHVPDFLEDRDTFWVVQFLQRDRRPRGCLFHAAQGVRSFADAFEEPLGELTAATIFNVTAVRRKLNSWLQTKEAVGTSE
jgi:hypothetical protein